MFKNLKDENVSPDLLNSNNNIGQGTTFTGNIETYGNIRIEGKIIGDVSSKSKVVVGPSAEIKGNVLSQLCEVEGHVKGSIEVTELLTLKPTCKVEGDILTNKLIIESGAMFFGNCKMNKDLASATPSMEPIQKTLHKAANQ